MKKKIVIVAAIALAVVLIVGGVLLFTPSKNFTVAFYKIDDKQRQGITDVINKIAEDSKFSISYIQYDSEKSLNSQLPLTKKPSVLITTAGHGAESAVSKVSKKENLDFRRQKSWENLFCVFARA